jgi:uncharacterized spore protein YtfJ
MSKVFEQITTTAVQSEEQAIALIEKLFQVAEPHAVFGEPVEAGGRTIITASEVNVGLGIGFGIGGGPGEMIAEAPEETETGETEFAEAGMGGGGGGGGGAKGRPIAVISVSEEEGVKVEPVIDATKVALAFFTTLGSMFFMISKVKKAAQK